MITNNRKKIYKNQNNSNVQQKYKKQNMSCHLTLSAPLSKISKSTTILKNIRTNTQYSYNCEQWGATIYIHTTHIKYTLHKMTHCGNRYGEKMFAVSCSGVATQSNWTTKNQPKKKKVTKLIEKHYDLTFSSSKYLAYIVIALYIRKTWPFHMPFVVAPHAHHNGE